jgi:hypothetical protein
MLTKTKFCNFGYLVSMALLIMLTIGLFPARGFSGTYTIYPTDDAAVSPEGTNNSDTL